MLSIYWDRAKKFGSPRRLLVKVCYLYCCLLFCICESAAPVALAVSLGQDERSAVSTPSFSHLVKSSAPAVVSIYSTQKHNTREIDPVLSYFFGNQRNNVSLGSGIIIGSDGIVVTNQHVVSNNGDIHVITNDGQELPASILVSDVKADLALLKIKGDGPFPTLHLGNSDEVETGDVVLAIGNPFGLGNTVTSGIISAAARSTSDINSYGFFIQTDAAINFGNSGGPLIDMNGQVIGINTAIHSNNGGGFIGIGFAIPSNNVKSLLHSIKRDSSGTLRVLRPWLGARFQNISSEIKEALAATNITGGVLITKMAHNSPLATAGIREGDIITAIDKRGIASTADIRNYIASKIVGDDTSISILREGEKYVFTVELVAPPENEYSMQYTALDAPFYGAVFDNLSPESASRAGIDDYAENDGGVIVVSSGKRQQRSWSAFGDFALKTGDIIVSINGTPIQDTQHLRDIVEGHNRSRSWSIVINRRGHLIRLQIAV